MHAVGTMVLIEDHTFMVCGYRPYDNDGTVGMGYLLLPYPMGFMNAGSLSLVPSDVELPIVCEGYRNEDAEGFDKMLEQVRTAGRDVSVDEFASVASEAVAELEADLAASIGEVK